jgi:nucleoside-diphosphate-sugar epimerase
MFDVNVMGTLRLIDALEKLPTGPRRRSFIFASAGYVYGPSTPLIVDESVSPRPFGDYAISKYCAEEILLAASENVRTVSARLFNVIGVGHSEKYVVPKLAAAFRRGDACLKVGNTSSIRDFIDVRDVAEALVHFGLIAEIEGPVNVCSGLGTSVGGIIQLMRDLSKREMKVEVQTSFARPGDNTHLVGSNNLLLSTGFELHYDLRASLEWMLTKSIAD